MGQNNRSRIERIVGSVRQHQRRSPPGLFGPAHRIEIDPNDIPSVDDTALSRRHRSAVALSGPPSTVSGAFPGPSRFVSERDLSRPNWFQNAFAALDGQLNTLPRLQ